MPYTRSQGIHIHYQIDGGEPRHGGRSRGRVLAFFVAFVLIGVPRVSHAQSGDTWMSKQAPSFVNRSASVVLNGKIYVFGDDRASGASVYDPVTNQWTTLASIPTKVSAPSAATVNGLIYVIGGYNPVTADTYSPSPNQVYDPSTDSWSVNSSPPTARAFAAAQVVCGQIYLVGGLIGSSFLTANEQYDPATDTWLTKAPMPTGRGGMGAAVVGGKIYFIGGETNGGFVVTTNEAYDPAQNNWSTQTSMPTARFEFGAAVAQSKIYTVGGATPSGYLNNNEEYDPSSKTWVVRAPIPVLMGGNTAAAVNGLVYSIGINRSAQPSMANYAYTPPSPCRADPTLLSGAADLQPTKSWPPDTTPYARPADPEDYAPRGRSAFPSSSFGSVAGSNRLFTLNALVDVVVNNTDVSLTNRDTCNDGETSIAINANDANQIVITAFSGSWGAQAPLWHSTNGGTTWTKDFTIPAPPGVPSVLGGPFDQTVEYGGGNRLSGAFLSDPPDIYSGTTTDPADMCAWNWLVFDGVTQRTNSFGIGNTDQPWLLVGTDPATVQDEVYVAYDDFNGSPDMRVAAAPGTNPPVFAIDNKTGLSGGSINPGHRLAVDQGSGYIYSLFQNCPTEVPNCANLSADPKTINYWLNRSTDGGRSWGLNGSPTGIIAATAGSTQPSPKFGTVNALLGGVDSVGVDPTTGDVYVVYGNRDPDTEKNRLSIVGLTDDGMGGLSIGPPSFVTGQVQAALPSVAVASDGTVGVFYYTFDGLSTSGLPMFTAHVGLSGDLGSTFSDLALLTFLSPAVDSCPADPGCTRQRVLGDFMQMKAIGTTFYGAFTANGIAFGRPFANNDPIFFSVSVAAP